MGTESDKSSGGREATFKKGEKSPEIENEEALEEEALDEKASERDELDEEASEGDELDEKALEGEEFSELIKYTLPGYIIGLLAGVFLDWQGYQRSPVGQWLVRTLAGEGESIFEGIYSVKQRFRKAEGTMAEAYGWGKLFGLAIPWFIDLGSRLAGVDVYGVQGFYIPYFYALSDQIGANISGMLFLKKREGSWNAAFGKYFRHPVMLASLAVITLVPLGLLGARFLGFSPTTQTYTALETIAANLCWVPPVVGWYVEKYR
ncbi:hypothetical protein MSMTP_1755 [Methanosarcina sp. MTP4]|uniref:hypothetical protein n=1 Tax=Methanosarcina sp. MTP4 TaxID=1434100 RepID=UPI0006157AA1|nr:hypothetical protein [Methanosarcina sp. MTP4]AKB25224.1 hypothetical protein MSMTP_1755 [Methanosarcina sp. MTP4]